MTTKASSIPHQIPRDLQKILTTQQKLSTLWKTLTPLAQNEWICWIESAKKTETRERRLHILIENIQDGKKRPCCWAGCPHRFFKNTDVFKQES